MVTPSHEALPPVALIDDYCQNYRYLFLEVRNYEAFKLIHWTIPYSTFVNSE
jgi:hypothetical protein